MSLSQKHLTEIEKVFLTAREDKQPSLALGEFFVRRFENTLWLVPKISLMLDVKSIIPLTPEVPVVLDNGRVVCLHVDAQDDTKWTIRFRQGDQRFHPSFRQHSQSLNKLFHEWRIPPWERAQMPLIYANDVLVAVGNMAVAKGFERVIDVNYASPSASARIPTTAHAHYPL